jgi:hypothetical protein
MAARQLWMFLSDEDVAALVRRLEQRDPGVRASWGRYLRGDPRALLDDPSALERRESLPGERRLYLFHLRHSADVVVHLQPAGPFAGWSQLDEERSDCLILRLPDAPAGELHPARLQAHVVNWRGPEKTRKRPIFSIWASQSLKLLLLEHPPTAVKFMRIGQDALRLVREGTLKLTYLYRPIGAEPVLAAPVQPPPAGAITEENSSPDDAEPDPVSTGAPATSSPASGEAGSTSSSAEPASQSAGAAASPASPAPKPR